MVQPSIEALPPPPAPACDRDPNCGQTAVFAYQWDWGEQGVCCALHAMLLQQVASQINRNVSLSPLRPPTAEPLQRDERTRLTAEALVLAEELTEAKARGLDLYRANVQLTQQVQLMKVRERELVAQHKDALQTAVLLRGELDEREAEHVELADEVSRLRTLEAFVKPQEEPPGLEGR